MPAAANCRVVSEGLNSTHCGRSPRPTLDDGPFPPFRPLPRPGDRLGRVDLSHSAKIRLGAWCVIRKTFLPHSSGKCVALVWMGTRLRTIGSKAMSERVPKIGIDELFEAAAAGVCAD